MPKPERHPLFAGITATGFGILVSRILGVIRESAAAGLLGLSKDGIMDAYVVAFRIPNLFRRLFGEGALTASYLPVLTADLEHDRQSAWKFVSAAIVMLSVALALLTLAAEIVCGVLWFVVGDNPSMRLLLGLTATMLPYTIFVCLAAMASATLQALGEFGVPALAPSVLNVCWLVGAWFIAPQLTSDRQAQAYIMAGCVLVGGGLQFLVQLPKLRSFGYRFQIDWKTSRASIYRVLRGMAPTTLGLAITQINTLMDSVIARGFSQAPGETGTIGWLGGAAYPLQQGAAAAVWYGERIYQFPLGMLGIAVATVIFPLLSRHAAQGNFKQLGSDLTLGLRLVLFGGIPAAAGLYLLAEPIARLLFEHKNFTSADTTRAAAMIAGYSIGVWAYCAGPVLVRGFYAVGDRRTPVVIGVISVLVNLTMNLVLIWSWAELALAISTSTAAALQVVLLAIVFSRTQSHLEWKKLVATTIRSLVAVAVMSAAVFGLLEWLPVTHQMFNPWIRVLAPLAAGVGIYLGMFALLRGPELRMLLGRSEP